MRMLPDKGIGYVVMAKNNLGHKLHLALDDYLIHGRDMRRP